MKHTPTTASLPSITVPEPLHNSRPSSGNGSSAWQLVVRHPSRLHRGRLQELVVEVRSTGGVTPTGNSGREPVLVRPCLPGVVVAPVEAVLDPAQPSARAVFQVTAVVAGRLAGACVEVWRQGQRLQSVATPMQAVGQGPVLGLAALALMVPLTLLTLGPSLSAGAAERGVRAVWPTVLGADAVAGFAQAGGDRLAAVASRIELVAGLGLALLTLAAGVMLACRGGRYQETAGPFPSLSALLRRPELPPFLSRVDPDELEQIHKSHPRLGHTPG